MRNLKMRYKMFLVFGSILCLLIIINGFSLVNIRKISNMVESFYDGPHMEMVSILTMRGDIYQMDNSLKCMLVDKTTEEDDAAYLAAYDNAKVQLSTLEQFGILSSSQSSSLSSSLSSINGSYEKIKSALASGSFEAAEAEMEDTIEGLTESSITILNDLAESTNQQAVAYKEASYSKTNQTIAIQDVLFVITVLIAIYLAIRTSTNVTKPVNSLAGSMKEVHNGNFNIEITASSKDELGILTIQLKDTVQYLKDYIYDINHILGEISKGNISVSVEREYIGDFKEIKTSLTTIIGSLNNTMEKIRSCCEEVTTGAMNLSSNANLLAQGSAQQASSIDQFQSMLETVTQLTNQDSQNAASAKEFSIKATNAVKDSDHQMQEMVKAIGEISASSQEIAKVIKIIEDIAFQTNILALNASVEAARAGEAGKGFAVVAGEVGSLAAKSAEAANNTTSMINRAISSVDNGIRIADIAADSLKKVDVNVSAMAGVLKKIEDSTQEQETAFHNMVEAAEQIRNVVQANSAAAEENSAASQELSAQAQILDHLVNQFQLKKEAGFPNQTYSSQPQISLAGPMELDQKY